MEKYRNPMNRPTNFSNPAGNVVKEMDAAEYSKHSAGVGSICSSNGNVCSYSAECTQITFLHLCCD